MVIMTGFILQEKFPTTDKFEHKVEAFFRKFATV
jgi:hypothetical protein